MEERSQPEFELNWIHVRNIACGPGFSQDEGLPPGHRKDIETEETTKDMETEETTIRLPLDFGSQAPRLGCVHLGAVDI